MNEYFYHDGKQVKRIKLPIGESSKVRNVKVEEIFSNFSKPLYEDMCFVADPNGKEKAIFFSTRGAYKPSCGIFPYIEVKGCGVPGQGIIEKYFLEDGRDKDEIQDPIGGFSFIKALREWKMLETLQKKGIATHIPVALLKLEEIVGPKGEELALLIRSGKSNVRLSYVRRQTFRNYKRIAENAMYSVGKSLTTIHNDLALCHNALHEENITLDGEIVDLEYMSSATPPKIYRDIWYGLLSFAEIFGTPLNVTQFVEAYTGKKRNFMITGSEMPEMEESSKKTAEKILNIKG